ncbi:MAG: alpha/beta fold hydrolase [Pseudomonadota bacterium]
MSVRSEKVTFTGALGETLAARLDLPDGAPRAYALFAHCFTCSKDVFAAARIAQGLADRGFAVLRFDFTGLGASAGEFANTNFSSNVADLVAAADYLRAEHAAPQLLVGHSLGGAAVLFAAEEIAEVRAVATIGAPGDIAHVAHNFGAKLDEIEREGVAEVALAGRSFTVKRQFLDDIRAQNLAERVARLRAALLVFHAPRDETVGIENASTIFAAARHPKSFVSLDDANHLLTRRSDARYVARVLSAWASRFVEEAARPAMTIGVPGADDVVSVAETGRGVFQQQMVARTHTLLADEPADVGGTDTGPTPYDLLAMSLGACTSMTLRMYARHKKQELGLVRVDVSHAKIHAKDCADCGEGREGRIDRFERRITIGGEVSEALREKLLEIADKCPVHKTLAKSSVIATALVDP